VTLPRPRRRAELNDNYDFKQIRAEVIDYLLKATNKNRASVTRDLVLPDIEPENLDLAQPLFFRPKARRRHEVKREVVQL
jgi:nitrate/nitrite transport system ATP-binding protein